MIEVTISEFSARCSELLERVRRTRQPVRVTRDGKPLAEVIPHTPVQDRAAWIASMKNSITIKATSFPPQTMSTNGKRFGTLARSPKQKERTNSMREKLTL
jgi:prevent-host-death family protein